MTDQTERTIRYDKYGHEIVEYGDPRRPSPDFIPRTVDVYLDGKAWRTVKFNGQYMTPSLKHYLHTEDCGCGRGRTRATTFIKEFEDKEGLIKYSVQNALRGLSLDAELLQEAKELEWMDEQVDDEDTLKEKKDAWNELGDRVKHAAGADQKSENGTDLHSWTEEVDQGLPLDQVPDQWRPYVTAYVAARDDPENGFTVLHDYIERTVFDPDIIDYGVNGTFDRLVMYKGKLTMLDIKTGKVDFYGSLDPKIPSQLALYVDAPYFLTQDYQYEEMPGDLEKSFGLVLHLPVGRMAVRDKDRPPVGEFVPHARLLEVPLAEGREALDICRRVKLYRARVKKIQPTVVAVSFAPAGDAKQLTVQDAVTELEFEQFIATPGITKKQVLLAARDLGAGITPEQKRAAKARIAEVSFEEVIAGLEDPKDVLRAARELGEGLTPAIRRAAKIRIADLQNS